MTFLSLPVANYDSQLLRKVAQFTDMMSTFNPPKIEVFRSPAQHYRMRAEFRIWHEGDTLYHIMFDPKTKERVKIEQLPSASELINQAMALLLKEIKTYPILTKKLFQIDYLSTLSNQLIISLLYHCPLTSEWAECAKQLRIRLQQHINVQLIGRANKTKFCFDHDYVDECLTIGQRKIIYRQIENSFTQPNASINQQMLSWAINVVNQDNTLKYSDLLELYCGNGNFSIALSPYFNKVLATEISSASVAAANYNIAINHINNMHVVRMSAEDFSSALRGDREFYRLKEIKLADYQCHTVLVDPPRSGLDDHTLTMLSHYPNLLYISCNPTTLYQNLKQLTQTHKIVRLALFDQFPYTHHIESGVFLQKATD